MPPLKHLAILSLSYEAYIKTYSINIFDSIIRPCMGTGWLLSILVSYE